jgi:hypothetical protein
MAATNTNLPATRQRKIGPFGTRARIVVGTLLLGSVVQGHLARGFHLSAWALGLVGFPAVLVGLQWLRARRTPTRLEATGPVGHAVNLAVFLVLYLAEPTSDAALIFYGASMWLAVLRGYAGCEVLAVSNWLLVGTTRSAVPCSGRSTSWSATAPASGQPRRGALGGRQPRARSQPMKTDRPGHRPVIEVLYVQDCPHYPATLALVERLRAELGIDAELRPSLILDQDAAEQAGFPGSPTVRVDGRDVEPGSELVTEYIVGCRLYRLEHRLAGQPEERWIREALLQAVGRS